MACIMVETIALALPFGKIKQFLQTVSVGEECDACVLESNCLPCTLP